MFKANSDNKITATASKFVEGGVKENLELDRIELGTSKNGNNFIALYWKDLSGAEVSKTEWEPKMNKGETPEILQEKSDKLMKRMHHMLVKSDILTEEEWGFEVTSFDALGKELIKRVIDTEKHKGVKVRAKVVYDKNNYTTLPAYTTAVWIENMTVLETEMRKLSIDKYDRVEPSAIRQTEVNPFNNENKATATTEVTVDSPF